MANVCDNCGTILRGPASGFVYTFGLAIPKGPDMPIPVQKWRAEICQTCAGEIEPPTRWLHKRPDQ